MNQDRLLTTKEVVKQLGISKASLYRYVKSVRNFPTPIKLSSATRFSERAVQRFIRTAAKSRKAGAK